MSYKSRGNNSSAAAQNRRIAAAFLFGVLLSLLVIVAGLYLNPGKVSNLSGGRYELLFIGLFIGLSTGHYIGLALGTESDVNLAAAVGAFLTISVSYLYLTLPKNGLPGLSSPGAVLVIATFLLILGHYSRVIDDTEAIRRLTRQFAERFSPLALVFVWLFETVVPPLLESTLSVTGHAELFATSPLSMRLGATTGLLLLALAIYHSFRSTPAS